MTWSGRQAPVLLLFSRSPTGPRCQLELQPSHLHPESRKEERTSTLPGNCGHLSNDMSLIGTESLGPVSRRRGCHLFPVAVSSATLKGCYHCERRESGYWRGARIGSTNVSFPTFYSTFQASGPEEVDVIANLTVRNKRLREVSGWLRPQPWISEQLGFAFRPVWTLKP